MRKNNETTNDQDHITTTDQQYRQLLIDEYESDVNDEAEEELEQILRATEQVYKPNVSDLIMQLDATEGWFPVSSASLYRDDFWRLDNPKFSNPIRISFDSEIENGNDLKRALSFYMLPQHAILAEIKSNRTAMNRSLEFRTIEDYILRAFHLSAKHSDLALITSRMINQALDKAKDISVKHYQKLFRVVKLWILLSNQHLIPKELRIRVSLRKIDTTARRADIFKKIKDTYQSWTAFTEEELGLLLEYALFWLEKAAPEIEKLKPHINEISKRIKGRIVLSAINEELENKFFVSVEDKTVMELNRTLQASERFQYSYTWRENFATALDHIRNALFIMIALVTGGRASELAPLSISDISNDKPDGTGDYWIRIVRWKTAADPTYNGEVEMLPLPRFVAECAFLYDRLTKFGNNEKRHWLFQSNRYRQTKEKITPHALTHIISQLKEELPIERIYTHRFRKTIAEILINQDERNLDIIRTLFGHKTFNMTMMYIARNPAMVRCVAAAIETSYTEELHEIITQIHYGAYSGEVAKRIAKNLADKPEDFKVNGRELRVTLLDFVSNLLEGGDPLFIKRTAVGTYCVTAEHFEADNYPPCIVGRNFGEGTPRPDPSNCHYECRKIVVLDKARASLEGNIKFYQRIIDNSGTQLPEKTLRVLLHKIETYQYHLSNLDATSIRRYNPSIAEGVIFKQSASGENAALEGVR